MSQIKNISKNTWIKIANIIPHNITSPSIILSLKRHIGIQRLLCNDGFGKHCLRTYKNMLHNLQEIYSLDIYNKLQGLYIHQRAHPTERPPGATDPRIEKIKAKIHSVPP